MRSFPSRAPSRKGFTLIELLIVITIIGILAVALVPRITQGPARARDVDRKADLQNIASALELYFSDNGYYPFSATTYTDDESDCIGGGNWIDTALSPYIQGGNLPKDPGSGTPLNCSAGRYYYHVMAASSTVKSASSYILIADVEVDTAAMEDNYCNFDNSDPSWESLDVAEASLNSTYSCNSDGNNSDGNNSFYAVIR